MMDPSRITSSFYSFLRFVEGTSLADFSDGGIVPPTSRSICLMRRVMKVVLLCATIAIVYAPTPARADGWISPFIGTNFGNNSGDGRANFGVNAGAMGAGVIGGELDFGYAPNFFGDQGKFGSNHVLDL